jgi:hypothetical protein
MSLRPIIARHVSTDRATIEKIIGPKLGKQFVPNSLVTEYALVLRFPTEGVVTSRAVARALKKLPKTRGATLMTGHDFTVEARQLAAAESIDLVSLQEFGWTDARYAARML